MKNKVAKIEDLLECLYCDDHKTYYPVDWGCAECLRQSISAAEARERELREKVEDFLSCERIIRDAGIMDNYTDAARARNRQAAIINEWKQLLGGEK